jgi:hypothetical protein
MTPIKIKSRQAKGGSSSYLHRK